MKLVLRILAFALPVSVTMTVYFLMNQPEQESLNSISGKVEMADKNYETLKNWLDSKKNILNDEFFKNLKIKHNEKEMKFSDLDESKKLVFKLLLLSKTKRDLEFSPLTGFADKNTKKQIQETILMADDLLKKNKENLYNMYGSKINPQDKNFLENLNVYLYK